ncbi:hypothetical protein LNQ49_08280 [Flavobacterium sp. F-65]|uniref:Uncharacterized protein n=1 Tax=Flavobacterium pisciphilum TaxID=2893755 RepID=A0ABS8MS34_9FLAO|nr:hypothetical protein [Flavobacterium sp. F-65]MCC9071574.1 hypothetical protein [Flavobacterium sp. F-65]
MNTTKKSTLSKKNLFRIVLFTFIAALLFTPIFGNLYSLLIEKEYFIPKQSSIFTFSETVHNDGSSDVWRYGKDFNNYYYNLSNENNDVLVLPKSNIDNCPEFDPEDISTWCGLKTPITEP